MISHNVFATNVSFLIQRAKTYAPHVVFVGLAKGEDNMTCPLPDSTTGKCYTKERVDMYNRIVKDISAHEEIIFVDVQDVLDDEDFYDGLHPTRQGHKKIYQEVKYAINHIVG